MQRSDPPATSCRFRAGDSSGLKVRPLPNQARLRKKTGVISENQSPIALII
jgi:hypothetical protein